MPLLVPVKSWISHCFLVSCTNNWRPSATWPQLSGNALHRNQVTHTCRGAARARVSCSKKKKKRKKPFKGGLHTAKSPHSKGHPQKWGTSSLLPFHPASTGPSVSSRSPTNPSLCPTSHSTTGMNRDYQGHAPRTKRCARNMSTTFHASHPHLHPRLLPVSHWLIHPCRSLARRSAMIGWRGHISPSSNHFQSIRGLGYSTRCAEQTLRA